MTWRAGFGRALLTPELPVRLAGFIGRSEPASAVHDDLEVRALWLSDGHRAACLLVLDLLGLSAEFADPIRESVRSRLGLDRGAVLTASTHTHSGPSAIRGAEAFGWTTPEGYGDLLVERCVSAAAAAALDPELVWLRAIDAPLPEGLSHNRRALPFEPWFSALDLRRGDGTRAGVLANVSIHPVLLGGGWLQVATDWVGPFRTALEARAGGRAILLSGALGDVNPVDVHADPSAHLGEAALETGELGARVAAAVHAALGGAASEVTGPLEVGSRTVTVAPEGTVLAGLIAGPSLEIELVEWGLGGASLVSVPGEPFHALGRRIAAARDGVTFVAGIAPVWNGYLPDPYGEGYEETMSLGPEAVRLIADAVVAGSSPS